MYSHHCKAVRTLNYIQPYLMVEAPPLEDMLAGVRQKLKLQSVEDIDVEKKEKD